VLKGNRTDTRAQHCTKKKKRMLQYYFSSFPDKSRYKIYEAITCGTEGLGIAIKASYNLKIY